MVPLTLAQQIKLSSPGIAGYQIKEQQLWLLQLILTFLQ